jgi:hypothetical protein
MRGQAVVPSENGVDCGARDLRSGVSGRVSDAGEPGVTGGFWEGARSDAIVSGFGSCPLRAKREMRFVVAPPGHPDEEVGTGLRGHGRPEHGLGIERRVHHPGHQTRSAPPSTGIDEPVMNCWVIE